MRCQALCEESKHENLARCSGGARMKSRADVASADGDVAERLLQRAESGAVPSKQCQCDIAHRATNQSTETLYAAAAARAWVAVPAWRL